MEELGKWTISAIYGGRFPHQRSLLREQGLTLGLTKTGECEKSMHEPSHQQLVFLHPLSCLFNVLFFLQYGHLLPFECETGTFDIVIRQEKKTKNSLFFLLDYQILQMLNDSNHGVREAAISCVEVC